MKRRALWAASGLGLVITVGSLSATHGYANEKANQPTCTLKTLKGRYMWAGQGTILPPAFGVTEPTQGADAGFHTFNGDGTGQDLVTVRINGHTVLKNKVAPTTYTVNGDCTGTYSANPDGQPGPSFNIFIAPDGESIAVIASDDGNYVSEVQHRVSPK